MNFNGYNLFSILLSCQTLFYLTAAHLLSIKKVMGEGSASTAISRVSVSDVVRQHYKIRSISFRATHEKFMQALLHRWRKRKPMARALWKNRVSLLKTCSIPQCYNDFCSFPKKILNFGVCLIYISGFGGTVNYWLFFYFCLILTLPVGITGPGIEPWSPRKLAKNSNYSQVESYQRAKIGTWCPFFYHSEL